MKRYARLTKAQKQAALQQATENLLRAIVEGGIRFNDELNRDNLQATIDGAIQEAERLQTPWFAGEIIMERAGEHIRGMAQCDAEDALYSEPGEYVLAGIA